MTAEDLEVGTVFSPSYSQPGPAMVVLDGEIKRVLWLVPLSYEFCNISALGMSYFSDPIVLGKLELPNV